jgi:hypothetical protein
MSEVGLAGQFQKPQHGHRDQAGVAELLRHVTNPQVRGPFHGSPRWCKRADQHAGKAGLAGTVRADDGDNFALFDAEIYAGQDQRTAMTDIDIGCGYQAHCGVAFWHFGHRPSTSRTVVST